MTTTTQSTLFDLPPSGLLVKPRRVAVLPPVDVEPIFLKWQKLPQVYRRLVPNPARIADRRDFWVTPVQAGEMCAGIGKDAVLDRMYDGTGFVHCMDVGRTPDQPYFRIPLEDCIDFIAEHVAGAAGDEI